MLTNRLQDKLRKQSLRNEIRILSQLEKEFLDFSFYPRRGSIKPTTSLASTVTLPPQNEILAELLMTALPATIAYQTE